VEDAGAVGGGGRRRRRRGFVASAALALLTAVAVQLAVSPPAFLWPLFVEERPSAVSGEPVPPLRRPPAARIAVAGDTGTGDLAQRTTARQMVEQARLEPYDALVLLGDLVYEDGEAELTGSRVIEPFRRVLDGGAELVPVLGNHDYDSGEQREILSLLGRDRSWYVEWVGPVRLVVLDTVLVDDEAQTGWLQATLAEPTPAWAWTVVAMHHPAYSAGPHGSDPTVRERWSRLFAEAGVPLVLAGHDHDYQRSKPQDGVTYVVSGAGAKVRATGHEEFTAVSASTLHYLDLLVHRDRLVGRAIDHSGRLVDAFTIRRD